MVSLSLCSVRTPPSQLGIWSRPFKLVPSSRVPSLPLTIRCKNTVRLQIKQKLFTAFASHLNPSGGDSIQEKSDGNKISDAPQGPPFLTILAGFLVFFLVCWIVGSFVLRLIGLIAKLPPSK